jgi:hypothetical protein
MKTEEDDAKTTKAVVKMKEVALEWEVVLKMMRERGHVCDGYFVPTMWKNRVSSGLEVVCRFQNEGADWSVDSLLVCGVEG